MQYQDIILISFIVLQVIIVIIPTFFKLKYDDKRFPKNITLTGIIFISACILSLFLGILNYYIEDSENEIQALRFESKLKERDSVAELKFNNLNKETIRALAEYNLYYEYSQKKILKVIKDSSKINTFIVDNKKPIVGICNEIGIQNTKISNDTFEFNINFCIFNIPTYIDIDIYTFLQNENQIVFLGKLQHFFYKRNGLELDTGYKIPLTVISNLKSPDNIILYFAGKYYDRTKNNEYMFYDMYNYEIKNNKYNSVSDIMKNKYLNLIK